MSKPTQSLLEASQPNPFSPVFGHGSCGGIQPALSVELKAAIYEGSANADLRLQLSQLVLHSLFLNSARPGKITKTGNKQKVKKEKERATRTRRRLRWTCRSAMVLPKAFLCLT